MKLSIEVDEERHHEAMEQAYKRLAPRVRIRGFRPGKAPRRLIEQELGHHRLLDEAMDILIPIAYREAVEENDLIPVAQPAVELVSHEPLVFTATVPLQPEIDLGDYKAIRVPKDKVTVTDEQIQDSLLELRRRYGTIEPVDRPAQPGDIISGSIKATTEGEQVFSEDDIEFRLEEDTLTSLPGLYESILGLKKGDNVEKTYDVPAEVEEGHEEHDHARFAGKTLTYNIGIVEVKEEKLADENDAFAKEVGEGFENLEALKTRIREDIQKAEEDNALRRVENAAVDALVAQAKLEYPPVLLDQQVDTLLNEQANLDPRDPQAVNLYIERMNKTEEEVRDSVREEAALRLRRSLVLGHFAEAENIAVEDSDIDTEIDNMVVSGGEQGETLRQLFNTPNGRETIRRSLFTRKTLARLAEITGDENAVAAEANEEPAQAEASTEEASTPKPKARRSTPRKSE